MTLGDYLAVGMMLVLAGGFAVASIAVSRLFSPHAPTPEKLAPYECGIVPEHEPAQRFPVRFYLVAMLFVIFDVEIIFFFIWGVGFRELGWAGVASVGVFALLVLETLIYVWRRGALDWNVPHRARYLTRIDPEIAELLLEEGEAA